MWRDGGSVTVTDGFAVRAYTVEDTEIILVVCPDFESKVPA